MLDAINSEYYGDDVRWFIATVINSSAPPGYEGRVRIRIHGVHNPYTGEIKESDLPWAQVLIPTTEGGVSGHGRIPQLMAGALVYGIFMDGKLSQLPLVIGSFAKQEFPTDVQAKSSRDKEFSVFKTNYNQERKQNFVYDSLQNDADRIGDVAQRRSQAMKFFIDNGYTLQQSAGIVGGLEQVSKFVLYGEGEDQLETIGIANWKTSSPRWKTLVKFSGQFQPKNTWKTFSIQLQFVLYELRTTQQIANNKLLRTTRIRGKDGSAQVFQNYYLKLPKNFAPNYTFAQRALDEVSR